MFKRLSYHTRLAKHQTPAVYTIKYFEDSWVHRKPEKCPCLKYFEDSWVPYKCTNTIHVGVPTFQYKQGVAQKTQVLGEPWRH